MPDERPSQRRQSVTRRTILIAAGLVGGSLAVVAGATAVRLAAVNRYRLPFSDGEASFGAWLKLLRDGTVEVAVPHQEMGQGVYALARLVAAEGLRLDPERIRPVQAPDDGGFTNPSMLLDGLPFDEHHRSGFQQTVVWSLDKLLRAFGISATGGSTSTRDIAEPIRACAGATMDLLSRAAEARLGSSIGTLKISGGTFYAPNGRSATYAELAPDAANLSIRPVPLPPLRAGTYLGRGFSRPDVVAKTNGLAQYGIDVRQPGQIYAAIQHSPKIGGVLKRAELRDADSSVKGIARGQDYVAVVATSYCKAAAALEKADISWDDTQALRISTSDVLAAFRKRLDEPGGDGRFVFEHGEAADAQRDITRTYTAPFLAHVTMEPMNATALVTDRQATVWAGHQSIDLVRWRVAKAIGISSSAVKVTTPFLGGGFGRRADVDYVVKATEIAARFKGTAVQTIWSRAEDIRNDYYRPAAMADVSAKIDGTGLPVSLRYRVASPSIIHQFVGRAFPLVPTGWLPDRSMVDGALFSFYGFGSRQVESVEVDLGIPVGFWRSVGYSLNNFFLETFIDELATEARIGPIEYRVMLLKRGGAGEAGARASRVLTRLGELNSKNPLASASGAGRAGRGFALSECFRSFVGQMADVEIVGERISVKRVFAVVDCGFAFDPPNVIAQVRSAIHFGLSAALYGAINIRDGQIVERNFDDYRVLTLDDAPEVTVELVESDADPGGVGEIGTPGVAPAVGNAIFAATGERHRSLPFTPSA